MIVGRIGHGVFVIAIVIDGIQRKRRMKQTNIAAFAAGEKGPSCLMFVYPRVDRLMRARTG